MNDWKISFKNLLNKPLYAFLSLFSLSISVALMLGILQLDASVQNQFERSIGNVDLVVGAKGSPLQLVLSSVLHLDNPTGNVSLTKVQELAKNPLVKTAAPISYGDNYKGYRIVGTTPEFESFYEAEIERGRSARQSMEVVLGSSVAKSLRLSIGDSFLSSHGLTENAVEEHDSPFIVVGIYKQTFNVVDQLIITTLQSIWDVHDHEAHEGEKEHVHEEDRDHEGDHDHEEDHSHEEEHEKEVTSMLIAFRNPVGLLTMPRTINENTEMQAALPKFELERLFSFTGIGMKTISFIAYIILIISCFIIFISLYKMVKERSFDLALMRTYGAGNMQLMRIIAYEGFLVVFSSLLLGFFLSQLCLKLIAGIFKSQFQQDILLTFPTRSILLTILLILAVVLFAILLAIIPVLKMDISKILSREK